LSYAKYLLLTASIKCQDYHNNEKNEKKLRCNLYYCNAANYIMCSKKISEVIPDKVNILGDSQLVDITEHPEKYNRTVENLGKILIRGKILKCEH